ncbi:Tim44 domain-containing protein [Paralcaligenes ureilyticus]|uniref:Putative lipid-binding transport protein (Tim44 family) n=1 Tax=Paralcaligenes ureilyticus TaxID=627131 RepID=A0A4R3MFZ1_9BURK|nr:TIM44-like domain-containing protein [Paralcaligenes ureilyticus]TCT11197.1 putative lipid-binding transport protein (Tim44 family) [Paralcaligenes ureilyticus]
MSQRFSRLFAIAMLVVSAGAMLSVSYDAQARRLGSGGSFGRQSSNVTQKRQAVTPPAATTAPRAAAPAAAAGTAATAGAAAKSGASRWLGPIAGIAAGLGIAALLSHLGLSGAFLEMLSSLVLIGILVFAVIALVRRLRGASSGSPLRSVAAGASAPPDQAGGQPLQRSIFAAPEPAAPAPVAAVAPVAAQPYTPAPPPDSQWFIPGDFDTPAFLTQAKAQFVAIQAIWDSGDVKKLAEYLTDDLIAEIKPQVLSRDGLTQTQVVLLNAELLGIEAVSGGHLASVRYSGMLRESADTEAFRFEEVWNLYKADGAGWLLAGIQQIPLKFAS